jgi:hypothetical protein
MLLYCFVTVILLDMNIFASCGTVGRVTAPQDETSLVKFPEICKWSSPPVGLQYPWGSLNLEQKGVQRNFPGHKVHLVCWAENSAILVGLNVKIMMEAPAFQTPF